VDVGEIRVTYKHGEHEEAVQLKMGEAVVHESHADVNKGHAEWHVSRWQVGVGSCLVCHEP
jgi:hypothetical protein